MLTTHTIRQGYLTKSLVAEQWIVSSAFPSLLKTARAVAQQQEGEVIARFKAIKKEEMKAQPAAAAPPPASPPSSQKSVRLLNSPLSASSTTFLPMPAISASPQQKQFALPLQVLPQQLPAGMSFIVKNKISSNTTQSLVCLSLPVSLSLSN